ncbi:MAG: IS21 family transposase [Vicinamibacteria bacterium]|nr:IS21 family transposase [Vicinamibacteria bacterium]
MLKSEQRMAVLELHTKGVSKRQIARLLKVSRGSVVKVIRSQQTTVPQIERAEKADPFRQDIEQLLKDCSGNLVRVHEELSKEGAALSYSALTAFCRRRGIGQEPKIPEGRYHFGPGQEQQHDTSPHKVKLGGVEHLAQTASLVLCFSRRLFFQFYPEFQRFHCKVFLTDALDYMGGSCGVTMIDNTHVIIASGAGKNMIPAPETAAFAERYGFAFVAHAVGDPDRKGRVEAPFRFIERNFLAGRRFADWADLNAQARDWCDKVNATYKKHIRAIPMELYAQERRYLKPLPVWVPEVYRLHQRFVDLAGYVSLHTNRYSVPADWISRQVEVRETKDHVHIEEGLRKCVTHRRLIGVFNQRSTLKEHFHPRPRSGPSVLGPEETAIVKALPEAAAYVNALKKRGRVQITLALRQLLRMVREYPKGAVTAALTEACHYGLYDLARVERMVLRRVARDYFPINIEGDDNDD